MRRWADRFRRSAFLHFALALVVYSVCPPFRSYDSFWTVPTSMSLLSHGDTNIDEYIGRMPAVAKYTVECVPPGKPAIRYSESGGTCPGGHWYNTYPLSISLLALPMVFFFREAAAVLALIVSHSAGLRLIVSHHPLAASILAGDFFATAAAPEELWTAALFAALAAAVQYKILRRFLPAAQASLLTLVFAFGTEMWPVASRSLLQHGPSLLLISLALYEVLCAPDKPSRLGVAGFFLALAYTVRPTNSISAAVFTIYVAVHFRPHIWKFLLGAAAVAIPFFAYNLAVRHSFLPKYFTAAPHYSLAQIWSNGSAQLVSPSRGLFIFTPVFLVSLYGMWAALRTRWLFPLMPYLAAIVILHTIVISPHLPGHTFGSRYFTDITELLVLFLVPAIKEWNSMAGRARPVLASAFLVLCAWGVFVHARGATSRTANSWSATPVSVDDAPARVWDWRDPQFLRGL